MAKQTRRASFIESLLNVLIGYGIAIASQMVVFPLFGYHLSIGTSMTMGLIFTAISIVRSFYLRRWFEYLRVTGKLR